MISGDDEAAGALDEPTSRAATLGRVAAGVGGCRRRRGGAGGRGSLTRPPPSCAAADHRDAERLRVDVRRELADDLALVHDEDPVGERQDLLELERDEQDRAALVALGDEPAVQELDRADVEAARRLRGDQDPRVARDLARDDELLLVAAGERRCPRRGPRRARRTRRSAPSRRSTRRLGRSQPDVASRARSR